MNTKIKSLQGLRFIAFLFIFIYHLNGYFGQTTFNFARVAVTFFFVLSGFVSFLKVDSHIEKLDGNILKRSFLYAKEKMSKIYPLYILSLFIFVPLSIKNLVLEQDMSYVKYASFFVINILLLESYLPYYTMDFAYAGWYLSSLMLLNFITIPLRKLIVKINEESSVFKYVLMILVSLLGLLLYCYLIPKNNNTFYLYIFPIYRIFEYFIGMCLSGIYLTTKNKVSIHNAETVYSLIQIIISIIIIFACYLTFKLDRGMVSSITDVICTALLIAIFMYDKGIISKFLKTRPMVFMGDISGEMYIVHNIFTAYFLGIATRLLPNNIYFALICYIITFVLTAIVSYIIHYKKYEGIKNKLRTKLIHMLGKFKQKKLNCKDFTIISNNCFAGVFYRNNALEYRSPTCGMFIMPKDYIKFIYNLKEYLDYDLKEIKVDESSYKTYLNDIKYTGTIGKLNDIEIMFLHYKNFDEAKSKWNRRKERINYNKIIYKFNDQNGATYDDLLMFEKFDAKNKLLFTAKEYDGVKSSAIFSEFEKDGFVVNDSKEKIYRKYIDMYKYINERFEGTNE